MTTHNYTTEMVYELKKCMDDPVYFINHYCKFNHPIDGLIQLELTDDQVELIKYYNSDNSSLVLADRQKGLTLTSCAYILWYALFNNYKSIMILLRKHHMIAEIRCRIDIMYDNLPDWLKVERSFNNKQSFGKRKSQPLGKKSYGPKGQKPKQYKGQGR